MKWKWLGGCVVAILLLLIALPAVTQAAGVVIGGTVPIDISAVVVSAITSSGGTITWTTNGEATSYVFYDTVMHANAADYANHTTLDNTPVSAHSQGLTGLTANTTYYLRVKSTIGSLETVSAEYTFKTATGGGGGGGLGIVTVEGVTNIGGFVDDKGVVSQNVYAWSDDKKELLYVTTGTMCLNDDGTPLTKISVIHITAPPAFPAGAGGITLAYDFTPAGAKFNPAAMVSFSYDPASLPAGIAETSLQIAYYDSTLSAWVPLAATVDTMYHFISAQISHFTPYAVTYGVKTPPPAPTTTTTTTTTTTITTPLTTTTTTTASTTTKPNPAIFNVSQLSITPTTVNPGQTVTISVTPQNTGDVAGTYDVALKIDYVLVCRKATKLGAGTKDTVTFTLSRNDIKVYAVDVNGLIGKFTVAAAQTTTVKPPAVKKNVSWVVYVGIGAFLFAFIATIVVGLRRERD